MTHADSGWANAHTHGALNIRYNRAAATCASTTTTPHSTTALSHDDRPATKPTTATDRLNHGTITSPTHDASDNPTFHRDCKLP